MSMTLDQIKLQDDRSIMNAIEDEMEHIASDVSASPFLFDYVGS